MTTHQGAVAPSGSPNPSVSPHGGPYRERGGHSEPHPGGGHPYPPSYYHHPQHPGHPDAHHHGSSAQPYYPPSYPSYSHPYPPHGHGPPPPHGYPPAQPGYAAHPHHHQQQHGYGASAASHPQHPHHQQQHYHPSDPHAGSRAGSPSPGSETLSMPAISSASKSTKAPKTAKPKAASKTAKTTKAQQLTVQGSSETSKGTSKPTPKTFRFEGSISSESFKSTKSFDLAGVNILNRKPLDTKTALDKLQRRRETHNRVERKRRDCINQLIDDLTKLLPAKHLEEASSKCHRVNVLRGAVSHIKFLNDSNHALNQSLRASRGEAPLPDLPTESESEQQAKAAIKDSEDRDMSLDIDNDTEMKEEEQDDVLAPSQAGDTMSRSTSPESSRQASPTASSRRPVPPPVIVTNAPSSGAAVDPFSLDSHRQRSNSFSTSIGDQSPRSSYSSSPMFPPSPISPLPFGRNSLFPPTEGESSRDQQQLSPLMGHHSPALSPSLPPISSLANLQLKSPSGHMNEPSHEQSNSVPSSFSSRPHRGASTLPPLTIPQPHHLHPSYHQGYSNTGGPSASPGSNRSSLTLSPHTHPSDQPPVSPFMLSPMLSRSPSMGPISSTSPGGSPYPHWHHDGTPSPQPYPPHGSPFTSPGAYPQGYTPNGSSNSNGSSHPHPHARHKSLQPGPIFIQEEPWNVQRKRSTSSASGKSASKGSRNSTQEKRKADEVESGPASPTSSVTSNTSYPSSPNPKKRTQPTRSYEEGEDNDGEEMAKRTKQQELSIQSEATTSHQRDSGVVVVVEAPPEGQGKGQMETDEDAAQALTSLSRTAA